MKGHKNKSLTSGAKGLTTTITYGTLTWNITKTNAQLTLSKIKLNRELLGDFEYVTQSLSMGQ